MIPDELLHQKPIDLRHKCEGPLLCSASGGANTDIVPVLYPRSLLPWAYVNALRCQIRLDELTIFAHISVLLFWTST
jgi:hypothetical protein